MLLLAYPQLHPSRLNGTDIVQATCFFVAAATLSHLFFGDVQVGLAVALLARCAAGVRLGAVASSAGSGRLIKPVVTAVLLAPALALLASARPAC
ncbi:hypothetical protein HBB16_12675 [Pseudonocardia sp. MCCB 268]|nr:hypothetical protein [Pseudonocardia cytotoxica]